MRPTYIIQMYISPKHDTSRGSCHGTLNKLLLKQGYLVSDNQKNSNIFKYRSVAHTLGADPTQQKIRSLHRFNFARSSINRQSINMYYINTLRSRRFAALFVTLIQVLRNVCKSIVLTQILRNRNKFTTF